MHYAMYSMIFTVVSKHGCSTPGKPSGKASWLDGYPVGARVVLVSESGGLVRHRSSKCNFVVV